MLPGRVKQKHSYEWARDLESDLSRYAELKTINVITLVTHKEMQRDILPSKDFLSVLVDQFLFTSVHYPIIDKWLPDETIDVFASFVAWIGARVREDKEFCVIHCNGGKGRSAMVQ